MSTLPLSPPQTERFANPGQFREKEDFMPKIRKAAVPLRRAEEPKEETRDPVASTSELAISRVDELLAMLAVRAFLEAEREKNR